MDSVQEIIVKYDRIFSNRQTPGQSLPSIICFWLCWPWLFLYLVCKYTTLTTNGLVVQLPDNIRRHTQQHTHTWSMVTHLVYNRVSTSGKTMAILAINMDLTCRLKIVSVCFFASVVFITYVAQQPLTGEQESSRINTWLTFQEFFSTLMLEQRIYIDSLLFMVLSC